MPTYTFNQSVRMLIIYVHLYLLSSVKMLQAAGKRKGVSHRAKRLKMGCLQGWTMPWLNYTIKNIISFFPLCILGHVDCIPALSYLRLQDDCRTYRCPVKDII